MLKKNYNNNDNNNNNSNRITKPRGREIPGWRPAVYS